MTPTHHRPFGVMLLSLLIIIGGFIQIGTGIYLVVQRNDSKVLEAVSSSSSNVGSLGWVTIGFGVLALIVGFAMRNGRNWARLLVAILALLNVAGLVWAASTNDSIHWYNVIWPVVIYAFITLYLFFDRDAKAYYSA